MKKTVHAFLAGTIQLKAGIATVSVAAVGVSPAAQRRTDNRTHWCVVRALGLVGGTPTSAGETPAIPKKELNRSGLDFICMPELSRAARKI